jgi:hypothetical protein
MSNRPPIRLRSWHLPCFAHGCFLALAVSLTALPPPSTSAQTTPPNSTVVLDSVVAVVNNQAILASDLREEMRLAILDPNQGGASSLTRHRALDQLIGRALIEQQIREEDAQAVAPSQAEVDTRLAEIRKELPACVRQNCASDAGWKVFLAVHDLTSERVETYLRYRLRILRFIELRFRQGIGISPQEIESYYHNTLLPQYSPGEPVPPLDEVAPRIQEILLQRQVNALFDEWLQNLRKQGEIEVLDPSLEASPAPPDRDGGKEGKK